jgi:hypothetical protein
VEILQLIGQQGGVASRRRLVQAVGRVRVDRAVASGELMVVRRGLLSLPGLPADRVAAEGLAGTLSGLSAARAWGWSLKIEPQQPTVTVPRNRPVTAVGINVIRRDLPPEAIVDGRTSRVQTVLDCARLLPFDQALCVADSALRDGRATGLTKGDLVAAAESGPPRGRSRVLALIEAADPRAANAFESVTRAIGLGVTGLDLRPQWDLGIGSGGEHRFGDLADPRLGLLVECDSWAYHGGRMLFDLDVRRYTSLVAEGWTILRFLYDDVMHRPRWVDAILAQVSARLSHRTAIAHRARTRHLRGPALVGTSA